MCGSILVKMDKIGFLNYLFYDLGKQQYDFNLYWMYKKGIDINGKKIYSGKEWKKFSEVFFDPENPKNKWFIDRCNQRQILPIEVVLDLESMEEYKPALDKLKGFDLKYYSYTTGSRGIHIHIFFKRELSTDEKQKIIRYFGADMQKANTKTLIALEYSKHWKSGKIKEEIGDEMLQM